MFRHRDRKAHKPNLPSDHRRQSQQAYSRLGDEIFVLIGVWSSMAA